MSVFIVQRQMKSNLTCITIDNSPVKSGNNNNNNNNNKFVEHDSAVASGSTSKSDFATRVNKRMIQCDFSSPG